MPAPNLRPFASLSPKGRSQLADHQHDSQPTNSQGNQLTQKEEGSRVGRGSVSPKNGLGWALEAVVEAEAFGVGVLRSEAAVAAAVLWCVSVVAW